MSEVRFDCSTVDRSLLPKKSAWWGIHAARYEFASPHVANCRVLDVACGTGYGLPALQRRARWVVGVDMDFEAVRKARLETGDGPQTVLVGDACSLPFGDKTFDVITSFETLEHLELRSRFLGELRRVLKAEGLCLVSTPNANYTQPVNGRPRNPHHVFEYSPSELVAELGRHFSNIELLGQVLDSRIKISPFIEDQRRMPLGVGAQVRLLLWRMLNKMPIALREYLSQTLWGHSFFPGDMDYRFSAATVKDAPVLLALCRGNSALKVK